jgi:hypothetical protein
MSDELENIPCEGTTIEPDLPIPQKDYEECDTCSEPSEAQDGDVVSDEEVKALLDEFDAIARQAETEDADFADSVAACIDGMSKLMEDVETRKNAMVAAAEIRGMLDELLDNMELYRYYHERRAYYYSMRGQALPQPPASAQEVRQILPQINSRFKSYSSALDVTTNYSAVAEYTPNSRNVTAFVLKYRYKFDVISSNVVSLGGALDEAGRHRIDAVGRDESFSGALYDEYYNKLNDPLNNFFTEEERGLASSQSGIDPELRLQAASGGVSAEQVAAAKQGERDFYIADQKRYMSFFGDFRGAYDRRISEIRRDRIAPALDAAKQRLDRLASYEAGLENDPSYSQSCMTYYGRILAERDRLVAIEKRFEESVRVDPANPMSGEYASAIKDKMRCLGNPDEREQTPEPPAEFEGDAVDTYEYGDGGMDPDSPNPTKSCYWVKFARLATQYGMLPFPDVRPKSPGQGLRYWPVGMIFPAPSGFVKIPLPVIWIHVMSVTTKFGVFVVFVTVCGIMPGLYVFYMDRSGGKKFMVTPRGPSPFFGYYPSNADIAAGFPLKIRVPFSATFPALAEDMSQLMYSLSEIGFPPFEELLYDINRQIGDAIDSADLPEMKAVLDIKKKLKSYSVGLDEKYQALYMDASDWISALNLPVIVIPKDPARATQIGGAQKVMLEVRKFMSKKYALPSLKMIDLKEKIMPHILELANDPDINRQISLMPDELDLRIDEHWETYKKFLSDSVMGMMKVFLPGPWETAKTYSTGQRVTHEGVVYVSAKPGNSGNRPNWKSDWWFRTDDLLKSKLMTPSIAIPNPLACREALQIPPSDLAFVAAVATSFAAIRKILDGLEAQTVITLFGFSEISANSILMYVYQTIDGVIPNLPLPPANFYTDFKTVFATMLKDTLSIDLPKITLVPGLAPPVTIDLNVIKPALAGAVLGSIDALAASLPVDLRRDDSLGFPSLDGVTLKVALKNAIGAATLVAAEPIRPIYNAASVAFGAYRLVGKEKNAMDAAVSPASIPLEAAKAQLKTLADNLKNCFDDTMVVPPEALALAMAILEKLNVPYVVVAALAAADKSEVMRKVHPLMYEDDLPPWERLNLKNMLFVLFLDEFCHVAKQHGGIFENYLP